MNGRPIEIVGGGLAGLSLGLFLARQDHPVTVFEAGAYPRHRVCGEFISGLGAGTLSKLGLGPFLAGARVLRTVAWFRAGRLLRRQTLPEPAYGISRFALDACLARAFVAAGGRLVSARLGNLDQPVPGQVIATGRRAGRSPWLGMKVHARGLPLAADLEVHVGRMGYVGLSAVEDGWTNVCGFFRRSSRVAGTKGLALLTAYLEAAGLAEVAGRLRAAGAISPASFCAVAGLSVARRVEPSRALRIGDACGMIAPFTGDGMAMAFQSAEIAAPFLSAYSAGSEDWPAVRAATQAALRQRFRLRLYSASALHPFLLTPRRQRLLAAASEARVLPLRPLYALVH